MKEIAKEIIRLKNVLKENGILKRWLNPHFVEDALRILDYEVLFSSMYLSYAGDIYILFKDRKEKTYLFRSTYEDGDIWESEPFENALMKEIENGLVFKNELEAIEYVIDNKEYYVPTDEFDELLDFVNVRALGIIDLRFVDTTSKEREELAKKIYNSKKNEDEDFIDDICETEEF